jgi:hypothetical protein
MPLIKIPVPVMMPVAHVEEWTYKKFAQYGMKVPQLTPSRIRLLSCNRTFSAARAKDQLGYEPIVSLKIFTYIIYCTSVLYNLIVLRFPLPAYPNLPQLVSSSCSNFFFVLDGLGLLFVCFVINLLVSIFRMV